MNIYIECEYCGEEYKAKRSSRKYCSDTCKTMAYRKRKQEYQEQFIEINNKLLNFGKKEDELRLKMQASEEVFRQIELVKTENAAMLEKLRAEIKEYYAKKRE
jgi:hypothetical protein